MAYNPVEFKVQVDQSVLTDLMQRLDRTRWSSELNNENWGYGANGAFLRELVHYWRNDFDWRKQEAQINQYPQYRVELRPGVPIHYIHVRGKGKSTLPIILSHGWPWTFWDWNALIGPLSDPAAYGGDPADAFDVVVPSLPGYGFSTPLEAAGVTAPVVAGLWHQLMHDVLGHGRYAAAGGDWGSLITWELGIRHLPHLTGIYLSFPPMWHCGGVEGLRAEDYAPEESGWLDKTYRKWPTCLSHLTAHSRDHQTLAWGLNDSPVGLAAWLLERRRNWSDCNGDLESRFSRDFLLTNVMLYWVTQSIGSAMRLYAEQFRSGLPGNNSDKSRINTSTHGEQQAECLNTFAAYHTPNVVPPCPPTGMGVYPEDVVLMPKKLCEKATNLVYWNVLESGGHFAPAEVPETYIKELRTFFRSHRH